MPKDNETIQLPLDGPVVPTEPQGFSADQMIRCDECLRANPPTRVNCLYCSSPLQHTESTAKLRQPVLRQPEKHELGFNCILLPGQQDSESLAEVARLVKLTTENVSDLLAASLPVPLVRTASKDEAQLVFDRLHELGVQTLSISDEQLGLHDKNISRARGMVLADDRLTIYQAGGKDALEFAWTDLSLLVVGRLITRRVEVSERKTRRAENEIIDSSQFFTDELVFDLYATNSAQTFRVGSNSFDFSCLNDRKSLIAGENLNRLREIITAKSGNVRVDTSYQQVKSLLDLVWLSEQETHSHGWKRDRPGRYTLGASVLNSNEAQFTRYSRLRHYISEGKVN